MELHMFPEKPSSPPAPANGARHGHGKNPGGGRLEVIGGFLVRAISRGRI